MKEITLLSGKGGTGKTTLTAALASIAHKAVLCDNDVDAADLHLILHPKVRCKHVFQGAWQATIDSNKCTQCDACITNCRFDAIHMNATGYPEVNPISCEGCRLCERICPANAIISERSQNNYWYESDTRFGPLVHARMGPGEENSGKLVSTVRKKAREIAKEIQADFIINDGPPGIGCSVISALSGTHLLVLITEPSQSGLYDAKRLVQLAQSFNIPVRGIINKANINSEMTRMISQFFDSEQIPVLAHIPFDKNVVQAMIEGKTIVEHDSTSELTRCVQKIWEQIK
ncbi:MinD superfamily P-loop ATPase, contains an inserted ferredoxin domain [Saccharicrinis carchari]|uniref:MinD superfamily P-loop ATPase, contains an inserted ferredoxin domain n=1 Tax=Saccharicrinis carchari TaxID=1168039 RepID=A0A521AIV4_SACCC|nr:ATP-binding protein [Saccharicrinis carchari]SMO34742.1 MinD superfamily P-loop ATPase, contains an inserted ferredoxin domain [Saccharicrinis carchari]